MKKYNQLDKAKKAKKMWAKENKHLKKYRRNGRTADEIVKMQSLFFYSDGDMICKKCGYDNVDSLCIEHIENNGFEERKKTGSGPNFFRWLRRNNFPEGYQILCRNCNWLKHLEHNDKKKRWYS